jgi:hypothetical protein
VWGQRSGGGAQACGMHAVTSLSNTSAYVSIRQHTSAYVRARHAACMLLRRYRSTGTQFTTQFTCFTSTKV